MLIIRNWESLATKVNTDNVYTFIKFFCISAVHIILNLISFGKTHWVIIIQIYVSHITSDWLL